MNSTVSAPSGLKVEIKRYRAAAYWRWELKDSNSKKRGQGLLSEQEQEEDEDEEAVCGICRQPFDATCPDCLVPGDDCPPVLGKCSHSFHMHCIVKWLEAQTQHQGDDRKQQCPMCRADWQFQVNEEAQVPQGQSLKVATVRGDWDQELNLDASNEAEGVPKEQLFHFPAEKTVTAFVALWRDCRGLTRGSSKNLAPDNEFMTRAFENAANVELSGLLS